MCLNANNTGSVTLRRVHVAIVAVGKLYSLNIKYVCVCILALVILDANCIFTAQGKKKILLNVKYVLGGFSLQTLFETFPIMWRIKQGIYHIDVIYHRVKHQLPFYILIKL